VLRRVINHIEISCGICALESPTIIYKDNAACVVQIQTRYIKTRKHISPKLFYLYELQEHGKISILQIKSCDNLADLFTKSLHLAIFDKYVKDIGIKRLKNLQGLGENPYKDILIKPSHCTLLLYEFYNNFLLKFF
jgi:hypothetical protein